jgi:hypothetical protein
MQTAAIILGLAALGGLTLAIVRFRGMPYPPTWMALGHGLVAATGLALLGYAAFYPGIPQLGQIALGILVAAALGAERLSFLAFIYDNAPCQFH